MTSSAPDIASLIHRIMRDDRGRLLAALIRSLGDFHLAEDSLSDALERALIHWSRSGPPERPDAWLLQTARRRAIDRIRKDRGLADRAPEIRRLMEEDEAERAEAAPEIPDERLRLIFTCCHPALDEKSRVALTLRTVGGLTTREISRAFLDTEPAMGQRISRAKAKIARAGITYKVPEPEDWDARLGSVLTTIYLVFNEGWTAGPGEAPIRATLCEEAIFLARLLTDLAPEDPEIEGLLALMCLSHARHGSRLSPDGTIVSLDDQDRKLWDRALIDEGLTLLDQAMARGRAGPFQLQAAISALHVTSDPPDWPQIRLLYDRLAGFNPSPVVRLNRAVAIAEAGAVQEALDELIGLEPALASYQPFHAALGEIAGRAGDITGARRALRTAIELSRSDTEKRWLSDRLAQLAPH